jgi:hypothetical protein
MQFAARHQTEGVAHHCFASSQVTVLKAAFRVCKQPMSPTFCPLDM